MNRTAAGTLLIIHTILTLALQLAAMAQPSLTSFLTQSSLRGLVSRAVLMQGGLILLPTLLVILIDHLPAQDIWGGRSRDGSLILAAVVGVPAAVVFHGLNNLSIYFMLRLGWRLPRPDSSDDYLANLWQQPWAVTVVLILIRVLAPALIEELMFRGVILTSLWAQLAPGLAIFWQAVAFALFHNDPFFLVSPFLAGLLLGYLRLHGGSLLPSMIAHASLNLTLFVLTPLLPRLTAQYLNLPTRSTQSIFYASLIATFLAAVALIPLLALLGRTQYKLPTRLPRSSQAAHVSMPGGLLFALALLMLLATIGVTYYQSV
ncbi:MAG: CPBP family intramembrane metalloprotease [Clostridia bacterium]|nr:CPBP family intramembrane metalloprotease [Clostridia bacterium]NCC76439.1 CPBP family intramembrane metalloprotease [Clostridia bacterium]